ncbi:hypothetical protein EBS02_09395, partial [bacterium]|nr:hypothetical protein [bacterium]
MNYLQPFALFETKASNVLSPQQEEFLTENSYDTWSINPTTNLVDVDGTFDCMNQKLSSLLEIEFGEVVDAFYCSGNELTSLAGSPQTLGWKFSCRNNLLTDLVGAPQKVGGDFNCNYNQLTSLAGAPQKVEGG